MYDNKQLTRLAKMSEKNQYNARRAQLAAFELSDLISQYGAMPAGASVMVADWLHIIFPYFNGIHKVSMSIAIFLEYGIGGITRKVRFELGSKKEYIKARNEIEAMYGIGDIHKSKASFYVANTRNEVVMCINGITYFYWVYWEKFNDVMITEIRQSLISEIQAQRNYEKDYLYCQQLHGKVYNRVSMIDAALHIKAINEQKELCKI